VCLLESITDEQYKTPVDNTFNASIGGHYRHCIEHFETLLQTKIGEEINYDARPRNITLETSREYALEHTRSLIRGLSESSRESELQSTILVRCKVSYQGDTSPVAPASFARELMYVIVHAIHHFAFISVMCRFQDIPLPSGFGVAPSTVHHEQSQLQRAAITQSVSAATR